MKYASENCKVCHGDISLNNIVINRIWDDDDDDDHIDNDIDDIDIVRINKGYDSDDGDSSDSSDDVAPDVDINKKSAQSNEIADSGDNSDSELTSLQSSSSMTTSNQPSTSNSRSPTIKAYGLVIDYDNSFSLDEMSEDKFKIHSVRHSPMLYVLHLTLC